MEIRGVAASELTDRRHSSFHGVALQHGDGDVESAASGAQNGLLAGSEA